MILALDISLSTGWARGGEKDRAPTCGVWQLPDGETNLDRALVSLHEAVAWDVKTHKITDVWIERPMLQINRKKGAYPLFVLVSLHAVAREAAFRNGARVHLVYPATWRVSFLGKGAGAFTTEEAKAGAMRQCNHLGWPFGGDHNAAEAAGIWYHAMATNMQFRWNPGRAA